jgi:hypothetical protein
MRALNLQVTLFVRVFAHPRFYFSINILSVATVEAAVPAH